MQRIVVATIIVSTLLLIFGIFVDSFSQVMDSEGYLYISSEGASPSESTMSDARKQKIAAETAYYSALQKLAEYIAGVEISSGIRLQDLEPAGGRVVELVRAELKGVEQTDCTFNRLEDGSYLSRSTIRIPLKKRDTIIMKVAELAKFEKNGFSNQEVPKDGRLPVSGKREQYEYTGLIIDVRMIAAPGWIPMTPVLMSESNEIVFHPRQVETEYLHVNQAAGYAGALSEAKKMINRIGIKPLIIRAMKIERNKADIILVSNRDADKIKELNNNTKALIFGKIILVL